MAEPFIAEVRAWGLNYAPRSWAYCDGSLLPISQNTALFSLVSTTYGGDGRTTLRLPDLQGRAVMGAGQAPGLTWRPLGGGDGLPEVGLDISQIPNHTHTASVIKGPGTLVSGAGAYNSGRLSVAGNTAIKAYEDVTTDDGDHASVNIIAGSGSGQEHLNLQPLLVFNYCIAIEGTYPTRS